MKTSEFGLVISSIEQIAKRFWYFYSCDIYFLLEYQTSGIILTDDAVVFGIWYIRWYLGGPVMGDDG